jgi:hypothetical protein
MNFCIVAAYLQYILIDFSQPGIIDIIRICAFARVLIIKYISVAVSNSKRADTIANYKGL